MCTLEDEVGRQFRVICIKELRGGCRTTSFVKLVKGVARNV